METKIVRLNPVHIDKLAEGCDLSIDRRSYFTPGSVGYCILEDGEPVFAGGVVNMQWKRGEAWLLASPYFRKHLLSCVKTMRIFIPMMAIQGGFSRIQATCSIMSNSTRLFDALGFTWEAYLSRFGPNGEDCHVYTRFF